MSAKKQNQNPEPEPTPASFRVCRNSRARHQYEILETIEAGLVLQGTEVKSLRNRKGSIDEAFARVQDGECWLYGCEIPPYTHGNRQNHESKRPRKLLLHRREIGKLAGRVGERGYTIVALTLYFTRGKAKVQLGVARGRKTIDKRHAMKERDAKRDIARAMSQKRRSD
jgi:SsrA-binding protein